jgi:phage terminase large subunit-like protein
MDALNRIRAQIPPDIFAAQYQQNLVAPDGNMIKRHWVRRYETLPDRTSSMHILQSWDTASKEGEHNAWTVCTTWYVHEGRYYLVDVLRDRFDYPTLKKRAIAQTRMSIQSAKFASGQVLFPNRASWLEDLEAELFAFPGSQFKDQIDSVSQALGHQIQVSYWNDKCAEGFSRFAEALMMERYWANVMGRPW